MSRAGVLAGRSSADPDAPTTPHAPGRPAPALARPVPPRSAERRAWVAQIMGMPVSVHARGEGARAGEADTAVQDLFATLRRLEEVFSTYRPGSQIRRLQRGDLSLAECDAEVHEVRALCVEAARRTDGAFDAWAAVPGRPGVFDPTGLVKSWAVERAARALDPLDHLGFAVGAGGDLLLRASTGQDTPWLVGIEDPRDPRRVLATVPVHAGGVATSGPAARGLHILDPRTGAPASAVLSATVVGPSLLWADVHATAAVVQGPAALDSDLMPAGTSGLLVLADGTTRRWQNPS